MGHEVCRRYIVREISFLLHGQVVQCYVTCLTYRLMQAIAGLFKHLLKKTFVRAEVLREK